jgi:hypothetical protein
MERSDSLHEMELLQSMTNLEGLEADAVIFTGGSTRPRAVAAAIPSHLNDDR